MLKIIAFGFILTLVGACQSREDTVTAVLTPAAVTKPTASAIAGDMAARLAETIGPAGTTFIQMQREKTDYSTALEAALKGWGYEVMADGKPAGKQRPVELSYSLDSLDGQLLAQVATPSIALARTYVSTNTGATASSPLSIMQRN
ncbi:conjugal transfer protein TrbH [Rhizobium sp. AC44/96]|uniref:conjugal transfer protein TrbH n=1 Tax=unclassified Rhizobium TaxID=2613769 RepID=UPI00080FD5F7|nr:MULTISPECIES: conjugal transfer protein TrbH [unclassified Rhizobium]MDM9621887.1 conjugal transfer protein TrbH [Rhizobium sp. S96]OCJ17171.1 conjugal transfer protein TrbH [Rhizobium sp. AC44/96]